MTTDAMDRLQAEPYMALTSGAASRSQALPYPPFLLLAAWLRETKLGALTLAAMAGPATGRQSHEKKVVLLGEGCVGKTSLVLRYCRDTFNDKHITTLQASFLTKKMNIGGKRVTLNIWDTAGQENYHAVAPIYYKDSNGAVLVYDITDQDSFERVQNWVKELRKIVGDDICLCIVGNKVDLEKNRTVKVSEAVGYAQAVGAKHFHTSAKLNNGIEEMFLDLCKRMLEQVSSQGLGSMPGTYGGQRGVAIIDDEPERDSEGCCLSS